MSGALSYGILLAQISRWQRLGDGLHRGRGRMDLADFLPLAIVLVVAAVVIFVVVQVRKRNDMSQRCNDPNKLFRELSLIHNLDRSSQKLLRQLADSAQLQQPAEVFLRPGIFAAQLAVDLRDQEEAYQSLQQRLFS
ncbi:MAG: hypothetical protein AAGD11_19750 [Planctomycetota bacterium]